MPTELPGVGRTADAHKVLVAVAQQMHLHVTNAIIGPIHPEKAHLITTATEVVCN